MRVSGVASPTVFSSPGAAAILRGRRAPPTCPQCREHPPPPDPLPPLQPSRKAKCRGAPRTNRVWGSLKGFPGAQLPPDTSLPSGGIGAPLPPPRPTRGAKPPKPAGPEATVRGCIPSVSSGQALAQPPPPSPASSTTPCAWSPSPCPSWPLLVDVLCYVVVVHRNPPLSVPPSPHPLPPPVCERVCVRHPHH